MSRWSAKRAAKSWRLAEHKAFMADHEGLDDEDCERIATEHMALAYLAGIRALIGDVEARMPGVRLCAERSREFFASERARLDGAVKQRGGRRE